MAKLVKISDNEYDIIDKGEENFHHIILKATSPYPDIIFQYGEVQLVEENDSLRVKFDYEVFQNSKMLDTKSEKFVEYIGGILLNNLEELLIYNSYQKGQKNAESSLRL